MSCQNHAAHIDVRNANIDQDATKEQLYQAAVYYLIDSLILDIC